MSIRLASLLCVSLAAVAALTVNFLMNPLHLQPHRFTYGGRFLDFNDPRAPESGRMTFTFFRDEPTSFDGDVREALATYTRQPHVHPLGRLGPENRPYYTHPGYQAFLLAVLQRATNTDPGTAYSEGVGFFAILTSLTLTVLLIALWREFGWTCAISVFALLMLSDWLIFIGASAYWASFTIYLPMAAAWLIYPAVVGGRVAPLYVALLLPVLVFIRCLLGGYEFITNILLSFTVPLVYYRVKSGSSLLRVVREVALLSAGGSLGFLCAFAVHCLTLAPGFGSAKLAAAKVLGRAAERTVGLASGASAITQADRLPGFLRQAPRDFVKAIAYLSNSIITVPFLKSLHVLLAVAVLVQVVVFLVAPNHLAKLLLVGKSKARALSYCLSWSFFCGCTWVLLMPGHMRPHVHFATIVFYVPWLITLYVCVAATLPLYTRALARVSYCWLLTRAKASLTPRVREGSSAQAWTTFGAVQSLVLVTESRMQRLLRRAHARDRVIALGGKSAPLKQS